MTIDTKQVHKLSPTQLGSYLAHNNWSLANQNDHWLVFRGNHFVDIVLARDARAPDYHVYVDHMLKTLASATGQVREEIAKDIFWFDRDAFMVEGDTRSEALADTQLPSIRRLIAHSANMERSLKPHFNQFYTEARSMLRHFEFHQEHNGSVRHRVESRVGKKEQYQMKIFVDSTDPGEKLPLERRVMERIATGLSMVDVAAKTQDVESLVDGYADGFNANMCKAVLEISKLSKTPIQFGITWSRSLEVSTGVVFDGKIHIERPHLECLKRARDKLQEWKPEYQTIRGQVIGLSSLVDPQSDEDASIERSIVVWRTDRKGIGKKLWINLGKDDYIIALKAHTEWRTISVDGLATKRRAGWQLAYPRDFKIVG